MTNFNFADKSNAIAFDVAYGPRDTVSKTQEKKDAIWTDLDSTVCNGRAPEPWAFYERASAVLGIGECLP